MARHASTYRQARREMARILRVDWQTFNSREYWDREEWFRVFGNVRSDYAGGAHFLGGRSKYMPHIGAKQRAKRAVV